MYHWNTRVRYSEVDENARLTVGGLINYLQDCCSFQAEDRQVGIEFLRGHQCAWVIFGWHIEIQRMPVFMEEIDVQTWPYQFSGFYGCRDFRICDKEGSCLARANSLWVLVNTETGRPTRVFDELAAGYEICPPLDMEAPPRKLRIGADAEVTRRDPIVVQKSHLDTNHHVNNGQYVQMAMEMIGEKKDISRIRAEYKKPAVLGDTIYPYVAEGQDKVQVELCNGKRVPYAVVELSQIVSC